MAIEIDRETRMENRSTAKWPEYSPPGFGETSPKYKRGVYFLANDPVYDVTVAFLNSLRMHNPDIPLCLIPYDANISRLSPLASVYNFIILENEGLLSWCDEVSLLFHDSVRGHYRKIAAWSGIFEEFIYIDVDTVVLRSVDSMYALLDQYDVVTAYSNHACSREFVWRDSIACVSNLTAEEIEYATNTGFILSRSGLFDGIELSKRVEEAKGLSSHMALECFEQPLLNYLIVKGTSKYTSIRHINSKAGRYLLAEECWAGSEGWKIRVNGKAEYESKPMDILLVHWSGQMVPAKWEKRLYSMLERIGIRLPARKLIFKQGKLWWQYRLLLPGVRLGSGKVGNAKADLEG